MEYWVVDFLRRIAAELSPNVVDDRRRASVPATPPDFGSGIAELEEAETHHEPLRPGRTVRHPDSRSFIERLRSEHPSLEITAEAR